MSMSRYESTFEQLGSRTKHGERDKGVILPIMEHQILFSKKHSEKKNLGLRNTELNTYPRAIERT